MDDAPADKPAPAPVAPPASSPAAPVQPPAPAPVKPEAEPAHVTLDTWANDRLHVERYPELIAGFRHEERAAGRHKGRPADYDARFADFAKRPAHMNDA